MSFFNGLQTTIGGLGIDQISTSTFTYTYPTGGVPNNTLIIQTYVYPQQPYYQIPTTLIGNASELLAEIERRIDDKIAELEKLDREGILEKMLVLTKAQLDALRSSPKYEAPKPVIPDKRQMELPLELVEEIAF